MSSDADLTAFPEMWDLPLAAASRIAGRYELGDVLGEGSSGRVHEAFDVLTGARVALKLVAPRGADNLAALQRELAALRLLDIPGVIRLLDDGEDAEHTFLVMELLDGGAFDALGSVWSQVRSAFVQLLETLAQVHFAGVLHLDLKPSNVLLNAVGRPVLTDFGLAQGLALGDRAGGAAGTPRYMAPEQLHGGTLDERTDLFAIGRMLLRQVDDLPVEISDLAYALTARDPADRPGSALEVLDAIGGDADTVLGVPRPRSADPADLRALFVEPEESFLHLAEDGAAVLLRRTGGEPNAVVAELERWVRAGRCHLVDGRIAIDRPALTALDWADDPRREGLVAALRRGDAGPLRAVAREHFDRGEPRRAAGMLASLAQQEPADLQAFTETALVASAEDTLGEALYRAHRAGSAHIVRLLRGCLAVRGASFAQGVELLTEPLPDPTLDAWRLAYLVLATGRSAPERLSDVFASADALAASDPALAVRVRFWRGNASFQRGDYAAALASYEAVLASDTPLWMHDQALTNAAVVAVELGERERGQSFASRAVERARQTRSPLAEAQATWALRAIRYRSGQTLEPRPGLVEAAESISREVSAQFALLEAARAYRAGEGPDWARDAQQRFSGIPDAEHLCTGLRAACGDTDVETPGEAGVAWIQLQGAALRAEAGLDPGMTHDAIRDALAAWPFADPDFRHEVLSRAECQARLT